MKLSDRASRRRAQRERLDIRAIEAVFAQTKSKRSAEIRALAREVAAKNRRPEDVGAWIQGLAAEAAQAGEYWPVRARKSCGVAISLPDGVGFGSFERCGGDHDDSEHGRPTRRRA